MAAPIRLPYPEIPGTEGPYAKRPYVKVFLVERENETHYGIVGLVDSGADTTCLPLSLAAALGYKKADLQEIRIDQVKGSVSAYEAPEPCKAFVDGLSEVAIELMPVFIEGCQPLWGRADFFEAFERVCFFKDALELTPG